MTRRTSTVLAVIFLAGIGAPAAATQKSDAERIVGTWRITKARAEGKDLPQEVFVLARLTMTADGKYTITLPEKSADGKYSVIGRGQIDMTPFGNRNDLAPGLYKFDGDDRVALCLTMNTSDAKRPTAIGAEKGSGQFVLELQRAKPGEEKPTTKELEKYKEATARLRAAAERAQHQNNLKQIALAFHNYHDTYRALPAHAVYGKDGKTPLLSWRVAILPFIEEEALYREFKLDEPWDSPHNRKLIARMPKLYEPLGAGKKGENRTHYQVFTGPDTLFDGPNRMKFNQVADGLSNTILVIEGKEPVIWTKPDDLVLPREKDKLPPLGGLFQTGISVAMGDGSVRLIRLNPDPVLLRAVITPRGGEEVDLGKLEK
jgi:uncharacterized protein (TIGR03067 family)